MLHSFERFIITTEEYRIHETQKAVPLITQLFI